MSAESYTRWHNQPSDDEDEGGGGEGKGSEGVTIVTSPSHHHHHRDLSLAARARVLCVMLLVCLTCLCTGVLIGYYSGMKAGKMNGRTLPKVEDEVKAQPQGQPQSQGRGPSRGRAEEDFNPIKFLGELEPEMIRRYMRQLHQQPKTLLADYIESTWRAQGLKTSSTSFTVNLSKPDPSQPNTVEVTFKDRHKQLLNPLPADLKSPPFVAFSAAGVVTGTVVFGNYGRREDLAILQTMKVPLKGAILLLRHGEIHDGSKVHNAEQAGASGVLLYPDPHDFEGISGLYPNGTGLPEDGVVWSTLNTVPGDPATPFLPSLRHIYRAPGSSRTLPRIPAQTISAEAAASLFDLMGGQPVPDRWGGALDSTYTVGGAWKSSESVVNVTLSVSNIVYQETLRNVHATLPGVDSTRVVMIGCHYGSLYTEPAAGLAGMLALSEAVGKAFPSGTQRKLMLSAWAASDYGMIGSTEFAQLYPSWLDSSLLAYLSLDEMLQGTGSIRVSASPLLREAIRQATSKVAWPEGEAMTVKDGWELAEPISNSNLHFSTLSAESDYVSFSSQYGIPSAQFIAMGKKWTTTYGLRRTQYDTAEAYSSVLDPEFKWTHMIASLVGTTSLILTESPLPPVDFREVSGNLYNGWRRFQAEHGTALANSGYDFTGVVDAIQNEIEIMDSTMTSIFEWYHAYQLGRENESCGDSCKGDSTDGELREIEDRLHRLALVRRGLLGPRGVGRTFTTHLMVGPDPEDPLQPIHYPHAARAITLALAQKTPWESVHQELSYILAALTSYRELFPSEAVPDTYPII